MPKKIKSNNIALIQAYWNEASKRTESVSLQTWKMQQQQYQDRERARVQNVSNKHLNQQAQPSTPKATPTQNTPDLLSPSIKSKLKKAQFSPRDISTFNTTVGQVQKLIKGFDAILSSSLASRVTPLKKKQHIPSSNSRPKSTSSPAMSAPAEISLTTITTAKDSTKATFKPQTLASEDELPIDLAWMQLILCNIRDKLKKDPSLVSSGTSDIQGRHTTRVTFISQTIEQLDAIITSCQGTFSIDKFIQDSKSKEGSDAASATGAFANMLILLYASLESLYFSVAYYTHNSTSFTECKKNKISRLAIFNYTLRFLKQIKSYAQIMCDYLLKQHIEVSSAAYRAALKKSGRTPDTAETFNTIACQTFRGIINSLYNQFSKLPESTLQFCTDKHSKISNRAIELVTEQIKTQMEKLQKGEINPFELRTLGEALINLNDLTGRTPLAISLLFFIALEKSNYEPPCALAQNSQTLCASTASAASATEETTNAEALPTGQAPASTS